MQLQIITSLPNSLKILVFSKIVSMFAQQRRHFVNRYNSMCYIFAFLFENLMNYCYFCKMKKNLIKIFAFFTLWCLITPSCTKFVLYSESDSPLHFNVLQKIDDTMTCCPSAALDMLLDVSEEIDTLQLSKTDYYEYQILVAEALYKNYYMQSNVPAVLEAVNYYDSLANRYPNNADVLFQKSRAYYYKAVGETENGRITDACADFLVALATVDKIAEKDRNDNIERFNGLIYSRLAELYYDFTNDVAILLYQRANDCFLKCNANVFVAINSKRIAKLLSSEARYHESEEFLALADSLISNDPTIDEDMKTKQKNDISMTRALNLCDAENRCRDALNEMINLYKHYDDDKTKIIRSAVIAELYYQNNIIDSALYYYEIAFENDHLAKRTAASRIIDICKIMGDNERLAYYAPFLADETHRELEITPLKAQIVAMFEQYEADKHKAEIRQLWINILLILVLLFIALVVVFYMISIFQKKKHIDEISRKDSYIGTLNGKIKKATTDERLRSIKTDELYKKLYSVTQMHIKTTAEYPELVMTDEERMHLTELFDKEFDGALQTVIMKNSRLKKSDELLLCLACIGLDEKHIAAVTGASYHNVFIRSRKCLEILGGGENLQEAIIIAISKSDII